MVLLPPLYFYKSRIYSPASYVKILYCFTKMCKRENLIGYNLANDYVIPAPKGQTPVGIHAIIEVLD